MIIEPNPLLPKKANVFEKPPRCSLKTVKFTQLKQFKSFDDDKIEELGANFNVTRQQDFGRPKNIVESCDSSLAVTIEANRLV